MLMPAEPPPTPPSSVAALVVAAGALLVVAFDIVMNWFAKSFAQSERK